MRKPGLQHLAQKVNANQFYFQPVFIENIIGINRKLEKHFRNLVKCSILIYLFFGLPKIEIYGQVKVSALGVTSDWWSDDTRNTSGIDLLGTTNTAYGKPGQTNTFADAVAINQQIQFVAGPVGGLYGGAVKIDGTTSNNGKSTLSTVNLSGFAPASDLTGGSFTATYKWYMEPNSTQRTLAFRIGIQSTQWASSQSGFTAIRSGESTWDLILVNLMSSPSPNSWNDVTVDLNNGLWYLYDQASNTYFTTPGGTSQLTLAQWQSDPTWGPLLFGVGAKVTNVQFGLGSSQRDCNVYVDYLQTSLLNSGNTIDFVCSTGNTVKNNNTNEYFCSIQDAIDAPNTIDGHTILVNSGTYNEQVIVSKELTIKSATATKAIINFTGTPTGKPTLFDVTSNKVTIENLQFDVDLSKLRSAIIASSAGLDSVTVKDNIISAYGTPAGSYGDRNAVSVNYGGPTNYRLASGGVNSVAFIGNTVTGTGISSYFRSGISLDEGGLTATGNTLTTINHDVLLRFASNGANNISNNNFNGGGVEMADHNAAAGTLTISNNTFSGAAANTYSNALRLKNNYTARPTIVSGNTFSGFVGDIAGYGGTVSLENYQAITLDNNTFTPLANSTAFRHVTINTKEFSSSSGLYSPVVGATLTNNTFNGSGVSGGTAIAFYNNDDNTLITPGAPPVYNAFTIGTAGNENKFAADISTFISFDNNSGNVAPGPTQSACWDQNLDARNNKFDVGAGLQISSEMSLAGRAILETKLTHDPDNSCLGLITYFYPVHNLTQNTYHSTIQAAVNAALNVNGTGGDVIECSSNTYNERVIIDRSVTLQGVDSTNCIISGTLLIGTGTGILINTGIKHVTIKKLTVQNFAGSSGNSDAGIYANGQNDTLLVDQVAILNNVGGSGFYANGPVNGVTITNVTSSGHTVGARGIVIWNGLKENINISNCHVYNNNCCGIELQDGFASGVTMNNNNVHNNGDNGMSALGLQGPGVNVISNNIIAQNGRFGIEIKNPNGSGTNSGQGSIVVSNNTVSRNPGIVYKFDGITVEDRDLAGICVIRRMLALPPVAYIDVPEGVQVVNNNVSGYIQPSNSDGFGIVLEGINHTVTGNTLNGNDVGVQRQAGHLPYPGEGDQANLSDTYFGRGNSQISCGIVITTNIYGNVLTNTVDTRDIGNSNGTGFVTNTSTGEKFCSIQSAVNNPNTTNGDTIAIKQGTYNEVVDVVTSGKNLTLAPGSSPGCDTISGLLLDIGDALSMEINGTTACTQFDQFKVNGAVTLGDANLVLTLGYVPTHGDSIKIIDNDMSDAIIGQFAEGTTITISGHTFTINYSGGNGNDVVLTKCDPRLQTTINGIQVTDNGDGTNDTGSITLCNSAGDNLNFTQFIDVTGSPVTSQVKVIQQFVRTNVTFGPGDAVAPLSAYSPAFSRNVSLVNTAIPGTLVIKLKIFIDGDNNNQLDPGECTGDSIIYTVTVNPNPTLTSVAPFATSVCGGTPVSFTASGLVDGDNTFGYTVTGPGGPFTGTPTVTISGGSHTFAAATYPIGTYNITIDSITIGGCTTILTTNNTTSFMVSESPVLKTTINSAQFTINNDGASDTIRISVCNGLTNNLKIDSFIIAAGAGPDVKVRQIISGNGASVSPWTGAGTAAAPAFAGALATATLDVSTVAGTVYLKFFAFNDNVRTNDLYDAGECKGDTIVYEVTVVPTTVITNPTDITVCDSYILPTITGTNLTGNEGYNLVVIGGGGGAGKTFNAGEEFTSSTSFYFYESIGTTPACFDQDTFNLTVNASPVITNPTDITVCDSYTLPVITGSNLSTNAGYFTGSNGSGTKYVAGAIITSTQTLFVYDSTMTIPVCFDQDTFTVTVNLSPVVTNPSDITICDSYMLPALTVGSYFTGSGGTGTALSAGNSITSSQTIYVYAQTGTSPNCTDEESFDVTINTTPTADSPSDITICDSYMLPALTVGSYFTGSGGTGTALSAGNNITSSQTIYVYAQTGTSPNCTDEESFDVTINITPTADSPSDITVCDSYMLPALTVGSYFTGSGGTGTALSAGNSITSSQTIYVYAQTGTSPNCTDEESFTITVFPKPTFSFTIGGTNVSNVNNGMTDASESAKVEVCDGGTYSIAAVLPASGSFRYDIKVTASGGVLNFNGNPATNADITAADLYNAINTYTISLANPAIRGQVVQVITPYSDVNGNNMLDLGDCAGDPITITYIANPIPVLQTIVNGIQLTNNYNAISETATIQICDSAVDNLFFTQLQETAGITMDDSVKVIQTFTLTNVAFSPANGIHPITGYTTPFSRKVSLVNPMVSGTLVMSFQIFFDSNNNNMLDNGECVNDSIKYTVTVNPKPTFTFTATVTGKTPQVGNNSMGTDSVTLDFCQGESFTMSGYSSSPASQVRILEKIVAANNVTYNNVAVTVPALPNDLTSAFFANVLYGPYGLVSGTSGSVTQIFVPYYDADNSGGFTSGDCLGDTIKLVYNVYAIPNAGPDLGACLNGTATMAAVGTGTWTPVPGNPSTTSITTPSSNTTTISGFTMIGVYKYVWTVNGCTDTVAVTVQTAPTATISGYANMCADSTVMITGMPSGGSGVYIDTMWTQIGGLGSVIITKNNNGTATITGQTPGDVYIEFKVTDNNGCTGTAKDTITVLDCSLIEFVNDYKPGDPCSCKNDQTANGAKDGKFNETITVTPTLITQSWKVVDANRLATSGGIPMGINNGDAMNFNIAGLHELNFMHSDSAGYVVIIEGPNPVIGTPGNPAPGNIQFTLSNICKYPVVAFDPAIQPQYCETDPIVTLDLRELTNFIGIDTFYINSNQVRRINPDTLLLGMNTLLGIFKGDFMSNTSTDVANPAFPGCLTSLSTTFNINAAPTVTFDIGGSSISSVNNGIADPSEAATVSVCNGGIYSVANLVHSDAANRYIVAVTPSGGGLLFDGVPAGGGDINSAQIDVAVSSSPHTLSLVDPTMPGSLVQVITPYNDLNGSDDYDAGDCLGDPITITYVVSASPVLKTTINSAQITTDNNSVNDTIRISVCNGITNNIKIDSFIITSGGAPNVKIRQIITGNGAIVSPWLATGTALPGAFANQMATASLDIATIPGTVSLNFFAFTDTNNDDNPDANECKGDTIIYLVTVSPKPTFGFTIGGSPVLSINNGMADPSEVATVSVCNGGMYSVANLIHSNAASRYKVTYTASGGGLLFDGGPVSNGDITAAQFNGAVGSHTLTLSNPAIAGSLVQVITPYNDVNGNNMCDPGDCVGDSISITYIVSVTPVLKTTINSAQITTDNNTVNDTIRISMCNGITNNLKIDSFIITAGGAPNVKIRQIITGNGASVSPWLAIGTALPGAFANQMATASLLNPAVVGTVSLKFFAFTDTNNDDNPDANECKGDTIIYLVTVSPKPTFGFTATVGMGVAQSVNNNAGNASITLDFCPGQTFTFSNYSSIPNVQVRFLEKIVSGTSNVTYNNVVIAPVPRPQSELASTFFSGPYGPYGLSSGTSGTLIQTMVPYFDVNNDLTYDAGLDCLGDTITITYNVSGPVKPVITAHPQTDNVCETQNALLSVIATGPGLYYQWQEVTAPNTYVDIPGANNDTLIINNVLVSGKTYRVVVYSNYGAPCQDSTASNPAQVLFGSDTGLACNKLVNISMGDDCVLDILPDMILEGSYNHPMYSVQVLNATGQPLGSVIDASFVNKKWKVQVFDNCSGNSCWGEIFVEDKLPPVITCQRDTLVNCYDTTNFTKAPNLPFVKDNCLSNVKIDVLEDFTLPYGTCIGDTVAVRIIRYRAKDGSNNLSNICERKIYFKKVNINDIIIPKHYDGHVGNNPALSCSYDWEIGIKNKYPDPTETGRPYYIGGNPFEGSIQDFGICKINITFRDDVRAGNCAGSIIIVRNWTIMDWCTRMTRNEIQVIKVIDDRGPSFDIDSIPPVITDAYACSSDFTAPAPINVTDCSGSNGYTYTVQFLLDPACSASPLPDPYVYVFGNTRSEQIVSGPNKGRWKISGIPVGCTWLKYTLTDSCGNSSSKYKRITVSDGTAPVAVCDEYTIVTLSADGKARVYTNAFDDGSYDNCSAVTLEVRRMTLGCDSSTIWRNYIDLCCDDPGRLVQVELRVTDQSGNTNICMVNVETQDKIQPLLKCSDDITLSCGADTSAQVTGKPIQAAFNAKGGYYNDNCLNVNLTWTNAGTLNKCGEGIIYRTYKVADRAGNFTTCTQKITVQNATPYNGPSWAKVGYMEIEGCINKDTDPSKTGRPVYNNGSCSLVSANFTDQVYSNVDGVCYKILRKWTVIDWCKFRTPSDTVTHRWPTNPTEGINQWTHTQMIKVVDRTKPVISMVNAGKTYQMTASTCGGQIDLTETATDCSPAATAALTWTYSVKRNNVIYRTGSGTGASLNASGNYESGTYEITWTAQDLCSNVETKTYTFIVRDNKKPTVYCLSSLTTVVMPSAGTVSITARSFDKASTDNCPGPLVFSFVEKYPTAPADSISTFTCLDFPVGKDTIHRALRMYVWDQARNFEYCTVNVVIQKNEACNPTALNIGGKISTEKNIMMNAVPVYLTDEITTVNMMYKTDSKGSFSFSKMSASGSYLLKPEKNDGHLNGISTLDLVLIQQHILGVKPFTSPYQYLAADANNDNKVTAADLVELRKLILGIYEKLPKNTSWRFFDKSQPIVDQNKPWGLSESVFINKKSGDMMYNDFMAIKTGDINTSAVANISTPEVEPRRASGTLTVDDIRFARAQTLLVPVTTQNIESITGLQATFMYDDKKLRFKKIIPGVVNVTQDCYSVSKDGVLLFSWNGMNQEVQVAEKVLFLMEFECIEEGRISQSLSLSSDVLKSEYYGSDLVENNLRLSYNSVNTSELMEVGQNNPNPFLTVTSIFVNMPQEGPVQLKVFDNSGKMVINRTENFAKGRNEFIVNGSDLDAPGVYFYEVKSNGQSFMKKMIKISQ